MPGTVFDRAAREELRRRMQNVGPDSRARWGKLSAPRMLAHLNAYSAMATGDLKVKPLLSPLANPLGRWLVIYGMKWPRGAPTSPELLPAPSADWEAELVRFGEGLDRLGTRAPEGDWPRHPAFGRMMGKHWGDLVHRHVDHHLRQFGV
jgi:hypothetical protein